jgi:hypothetical protein
MSSSTDITGKRKGTKPPPLRKKKKPKPKPVARKPKPKPKPTPVAYEGRPAWDVRTEVLDIDRKLDRKIHKLNTKQDVLRKEVYRQGKIVSDLQNTLDSADLSTGLRAELRKELQKANKRWAAVNKEYYVLMDAKEVATLEARAATRSITQVENGSNINFKKTSKFEPHRNKSIKDGVNDFQDYVLDGLIPDTAEIGFRKGGRARAHYWENEVFLRTGANKNTVAHELGHWLEDVNPGIREDASGRGRGIGHYEQRDRGRLCGQRNHLDR